MYISLSLSLYICMYSMLCSGLGPGAVCGQGLGGGGPPAPQWAIIVGPGAVLGAWEGGGHGLGEGGGYTYYQKQKPLNTKT